MNIAECSHAIYMHIAGLQFALNSRARNAVYKDKTFFTASLLDLDFEILDFRDLCQI